MDQLISLAGIWLALQIAGIVAGIVILVVLVILWKKGTIRF